LFVQKAPASTVGQLAEVLNTMFNGNKGIRIIGTRHGEKLYETLLTTEEKLRSTDLGEYFKVSPDDRDLNYDKYVSTGQDNPSEFVDYNSHNTRRLLNSELEELLLSLHYVKEELGIL